MTNWIEKYQLGNKTRGKLVKNSEGKILLDKNGMPVHLPEAGTAKLTASPIDAGVIAATGVGPLILKWAGANILGNIMASSINQFPEAIGSITGNISKLPISEDIKRVGGFNDFIQAKRYLKSGNLGKGAWNIATGIGGVYDSKRWTPNWKYDDILDKSLEYMNAAGDSFDAVKGLQELKASGGTIPKAQEGVKVSEDRRNWLQRTNDKIQTTYNKNKPQLLKDFPLLDLPGMMVEYVTGHSEDPDAGLAMVNPVGKVGRIKALSSTDGKIKLLRNEKGEVDFLSSEDWQDAIRTASKNIRTYFGDSKYKNIVEKNQALSNRLKINQPPLPIERVHNLPLQESRLAQQSHLIGVGDPRPLEAAILKGETKTAATYSRTLGGEGKITIPRIFPKEQTIRSAEHELLHHTYPNLGEGYPSFTQLETDKIKRVFKPSKELRALEQSTDIPLWYLDEADELIPNTFDMANDLGISKFQPYIGYKNFKPMLDNYKGYKSFIKDAMKLDSPRDYKRAWDLMTGVRVGTIPAVLGGTAAVANKNNFVEKRQKGGIINKWMYKNMNPTMDIPSNIPGFVSVFNMKEVEPVARAGWAKRLGQPYNKKLLPTNPDGSVRLPDSVARQIETDTVAIKNKYKLYEDIAKSIGPEYSENSKLNAEKNLSLINSYLNKLREAYKGNEVTVNEYEARKGAFDNQGYLNQETTPLNVLGNFAIKYNPITKRMEYRDTYDFIRGKGNKINFFERVIPGKPFEIRGVVPK